MTLILIFKLPTVWRNTAYSTLDTFFGSVIHFSSPAFKTASLASLSENRISMKRFLWCIYRKTREEHYRGCMEGVVWLRCPGFPAEPFRGRAFWRGRFGARMFQRRIARRRMLRRLKIISRSPLHFVGALSLHDICWKSHSEKSKFRLYIIYLLYKTVGEGAHACVCWMRVKLICK